MLPPAIELILVLEVVGTTVIANPMITIRWHGFVIGRICESERVLRQKVM
jgi:hypothetical protein